MAPNPERSIRRSVYATDVKDGPQSMPWRAYGALEVGFDRSLASEPQQVVLFRDFNDGNILDISSSVSISKIPPDSSTSFDVTGTLEQSNDPKIGFKISVDSLEPLKCKFHGSFSKVAQVDAEWKGSCVAFRDTALGIVQAGLQPLDSQVQEFIEMIPLENNAQGKAFDNAQDWANDIFIDLMVRAMPFGSRNFLFNDLQPVGKKLETRMGRSIPPQLSENSTHTYISLKAILDNNHRFFEVMSMHKLCHALKQADWLDADVKAAIRDRAESFVKMLQCKPEELSACKDEYGPYFRAAQEIDNLRSQYKDAITRCYFAAYFCLRQDKWERFLQSPNDLFSKSKTVLLSQHYKEHWLPRLVAISNRAGSMPIPQRLALLGDKLTFLKRANGQTDFSEVDSIILDLCSAASATGIARTSLIGPDMDEIVVKPDEQIEPQLTVLGNFEMMDFPHDNFVGNTVGLSVHYLLRRDAGELDLYNYRITSSAPFTSLLDVNKIYDKIFDFIRPKTIIMPMPGTLGQRHDGGGNNDGVVSTIRGWLGL